MATRKRSQRSMSHPVEVRREVIALKNSERRLLGIAAGLKVSVSTSTLHLGWLPAVLLDSIVTEARDLSDIAVRLRGLLGPDTGKRDGGA